MRRNVCYNMYGSIECAGRTSAKEEKMHCRYCGKEMDDDAKVCRYCGRAVAESRPVRQDDDVNTFAVLSALFAFLLPFAGIVFGAVGLHSAKKTGGNGRRLAFVGLIPSITIFVLMMTRILGIAVIAPAIKGGVSAS